VRIDRAGISTKRPTLIACVTDKGSNFVPALEACVHDRRMHSLNIQISDIFTIVI